ncbi:hypothetical protein Hanom_Chr06g00495271 [Helianthus anomalus]
MVVVRWWWWWWWGGGEDGDCVCRYIKLKHYVFFIPISTSSSTMVVSVSRKSELFYGCLCKQETCYLLEILWITLVHLWLVHLLCLFVHSAEDKKQTVFFLQTAEVWSTHSAIDICRCGPQSADILPLKIQTAP